VCYSQRLDRSHAYYVEGAGWLLEAWKYAMVTADGGRAAPLAETEDQRLYRYRVRRVMHSQHGFHVLATRRAAVEMLLREHGDHPRRRYLIVRCLVPENAIESDGHAHELYMLPNGRAVGDDDIERATVTARRSAREAREIESAIELLRAAVAAPELVEVEI